MKERLKKLTPGPQDPGPSGGLCSRNHMVKLTAADFLSPSLPFPNPRPRLLSSSHSAPGAEFQERGLSGSLISCHPLASRKQSALNLHKGPGRRHAPKGGGEAVLKDGETAAVCSPIIMTPALGQSL